MDKSNRWSEHKEETPGPAAYSELVIQNVVRTPRAKLVSGMLNSSVSSSASTSSQNGFLSPMKHSFARSKSFRSSQKKGLLDKDLRDKLQILQSEKSQMLKSIAELEEELALLKSKTSLDKLIDSATQVDLNLECTSQDTFDGPEDLSCKMKSKAVGDDRPLSCDELILLRDQIAHLTLLRDNLEASVASKENVIADLQMQIDLIVSEAEEGHEQMRLMQENTSKIEKELNRKIEENQTQSIHVKDLISKYESLLKKHEDMMQSNKEVMAQKDIEIELLNDSISTLNTQVSEYERTVNRIQSEVTLKKTQISSLEMTLGDLSIATKEKEFVETMLEDEIQEKNREVSKLELTLQDVATKLEEIREDRERLVSKMHEEQNCLAQMKEKVKAMEVSMKEKEVVQQFLEKEVACREEEVSASNKRVVELENELELARKVALDLQQEAEGQLNELFCIKASLNAKDYDLETKEELLTSLREEMTHKTDNSNKSISELITELKCKESKIISLEENITNLKSALDKEEENTSQLEERVVQLMVEVDEREELYKQKLLRKDSEIEELSVKYSDSLLEQESTKRLLNATSEKLDNERLIVEASERELDLVRQVVEELKAKKDEMENSYRELNHKLIHIEDALACEEAESREIQKKLENTETELEKALEENRALKSSLEGYTGQISTLKIDIAKKSLAVEEMQARIEELREEKIALSQDNAQLVEEMTSLRATILLLETTSKEKNGMLNDLQNELEVKMKTVTELEDDLIRKGEELSRINDALKEKLKDEEQQVVEFEEEKSQFFEQISHLQNHLKEEQDLNLELKTKAGELENKLIDLDKEKEKEINSLQTLLNEEKSKVNELIEEIKSLNKKYEDDLTELQTSLAEKWNLSRMDESTSSSVSQTYKDKIEELKSNISRLVKESEQLSLSLSSKENLLTSLNDSVSVKSEEIHCLHKNMEDKESKISSLESRLKEMELTVTLLKEERDFAASRVFSLEENLNLTKEELAKVNDLMSSEVEKKLSLQATEFESRLEGVRLSCEAVQRESDTWQKKFLYLEKMVEPFREQLDAYELEKSTLLSKSCAAEEEVKKLSDEYARLLSHNNHKQKIQHVIKLKTENNELKERVVRLQNELQKQKKAIRRLEDREEIARGRSFHSNSKSNLYQNEADKENSSPVLSANHHSTPFRSSSLNSRFYRM